MASAASTWTRKPGNWFVLEQDGYKLEARENKFSLHGGFLATVVAPDGTVVLDKERADTKSRAMNRAKKVMKEHAAAAKAI